MNASASASGPGISGLDLRAHREAAGVSVSALARAYGVARQRIQELERRAVVDVRVARRYNAALDAAGRAAAEEAP